MRNTKYFRNSFYQKPLAELDYENMTMKRRLFPALARTLLFGCLFAVSLAPTFANPAHGSNPAAASIPVGTFEQRLPNGLRVIVKEDHRAPTAVHMVWYRAGAMDEKDGTSGVAHVLEHMMFKGTKNHATGEFNKIVAEAGGRDNAFTSLDYTAYFQIVPKRALPQMMALEADRMANLKLTAKEFEQEIKVVMEERRLRTDDNPVAQVHEALNAAAFRAHPYRRPIIGWMDDLEQMTDTDARDWYRDWYTPGNAYVVVVGDVDHREIFRLAEKTYGRIKSHGLPVRKPQNEPEQTGIKRVVVKAPAKLPYLIMGWKVPKLLDIDKDREPYALEVLSTVLDGHDAARFAKNLVRGQKIAQSAGAGYGAMARGEALFLVDGKPVEGKTVAELEAALRAEIKRVQDEGVSVEELARVKTQTIAAQVYKRDSMMAQAMEIGALEAVGQDWRNIDKLIEKIRGVTAEEVQAVAKKYFKDDTLTVAVLDPQPLDQAKPRRSTFTPRH